jgi:hypothetical protein
VLIVALAAASVAQVPAPASARRSAAAAAPTSSTSHAFEGALESLPEWVPAALLVREPNRFLARARGLLAPLPVKVRDRLAAEWITLRDLDFEDAGIDGDAPAWVVPSFGDQPALARFGLADHRRFEAFAARRAAGRGRLRIGAMPAWVFDADLPSPIACTRRERWLYCQRGVSPEREPFAHLERLLEAPGRRLAHHDGLQAAAAQLDPDADLLWVLRPDAAASHLAGLWLAQVEHELRLAPPELRRRREADARRWTAWFHQRARWLRGLAGSVDLETLRVAVDVALEPAGAELVRSIAGRPRPDDRLSGWVKTPAIARAVAHLTPEVTADLLQRSGLSLPVDRLSGSIAALALGLDAECPAAKRGGPKEASALPFVFPMAAAIGLVDGAGRERRWLVQALGIEPPRAAGNVLMSGLAHGSPYEVRAANEAVLIGTGPGAGAAAARRWSGAMPIEVAPAAFAEIAIDLRALDAALGSASFGGETRRELRELASWLERSRPAREPFTRIEAKLSALDRGERLHLELEIHR